MNVEHKAVPVAGFKVLDEAQGIVQAIVSVTGIVDDVKDNINPGAYEKTLAARTPKGCWSHDWDQPVSKTLAADELQPGDPGLPEKQRNDEPWPAEAGGLQVKTQFNLGTQRGREAFADVVFFGDEQEWSIGYAVPVGGAKVDPKTGVRDIKEIELFEYSPVLFGAMSLTATTGVKDAQEAWKQAHGDPEAATALLEAKAAAADEPEGADDAGKMAAHEFVDDNDDGLCDTCGLSEEDHGDGTGGDPNYTKDEKAAPAAGNKAAIASHSTDVSDAAWDGPAQEKNLGDSPTEAQLRKAHAWVDDEGDPETKAAYKFVHHFVEDGAAGAASSRACSTGIGVLNGGRGGTSIPDGDVKGVHAHLAKHLTDAGLDAPELKLADADAEKGAKDVSTDSPSGDGVAPAFGAVEGTGTTGSAPSITTYKVEERDGEWCVVDDETDVAVKCFATEAEADDHLAELTAPAMPAKDASGTSFVIQGVTISGISEEIRQRVEKAVADALTPPPPDGEEKVYMALSGSYERRQQALWRLATNFSPPEPVEPSEDPVEDWFDVDEDPDGYYDAYWGCWYESWDEWTDVEATYDDRVVLAHYDYDAEVGEPTVRYFEVPYSFDEATGIAVPSGVPREVVVTASVQAKSLRRAKRARSAGKAGRVLSGGNSDLVVSAVGQLIALLDQAGIDHPWTDEGNSPTDAQEDTDATVHVTTGDTDRTSLTDGKVLITADEVLAGQRFVVGAWKGAAVPALD